MIFFNLNKLIKIALLLTPMIVNADGERAGPPQMPDLDAGTNLSSELSNWRTDLQAFFDSQGGDHTVSYGIGSLDIKDKSSSRYIASVTGAYKEALIKAYVELSKQINPDGLNNITSDRTETHTVTGDALLDQEKQKCRKKALLAFEAHKRKLEKKLEEKNSFLGIIKTRLKEDGESGSSKPEEKPKQEDFIHTCFVDGPSFNQEEGSTQHLEDVLSGGRIWATVIHNGKLGLILIRSSDTSEVASVLKNQLMPSNVNASALVELRDRIKQELAQYEGIPLGIVGTRMLRLSNREWAIYSYGAAQTMGQSSGGFMDSVMEGVDMQNAQHKAMAELSRFSGLTIDFDRIYKKIRQTQQPWTIDCNVTKNNNCVLKKNEEQTFGEIIDETFSASSNLKLVGSEQIFTQQFSDGPLTYYLSARAWSPSLMAKNIGKRKSQDTAAENVARSGKYQTNSPAPDTNQSGGGKSKVIIMNQDW